MMVNLLLFIENCLLKFKESKGNFNFLWIVIIEIKYRRLVSINFN